LNRDKLLLSHILDAAAFVLKLAELGEEEFKSDRRTRDAAIRNLEIIGEATKHLSAELKKQHFDVPWKRIAGLRDVLIHGYYKVEPDALWVMTKTDLPGFYARIQDILRIFPD
jgi:uncharacterized protein with HEPN domain